MRRAVIIAAAALVLPATAEAQMMGPMCAGKYLGKTSRDTGEVTYHLTSKQPGTFPSSRSIQFRMRWTYYKCRRSWRLTLQPWISDGSATSALRLYLRDEHGDVRKTPMEWRWVEGWLQTQTMTRKTRRWYPESALMAGLTLWTGDDAETRGARWTSPFDGTGWDIRQP